MNSSSSSSRSSGSEHRNFLFDHPHFPLGYAYSLVFLAACVVVFAAAAPSATAAGCVFSWTIYRALSHNRSVALELQFHTDSRRNSGSGSDENFGSSLLSDAVVGLRRRRYEAKDSPAPVSLLCMGLRVCVSSDQVKSGKCDAD